MGQGSFFSLFLFSFDEYYYEEKVGWNDLAFLSVFFFSSLFFFSGSWSSRRENGIGIFLSSGSRKKRQKGKQNATEQDSHQTMTAMTAMEGTCRLAARRMEIRPKVE